MKAKNDTQTKERLLAVAKEEFMEKGYLQASLRSICKRAGVTTGALYFFFKDKEDLFGTIVNEPLEKLVTLMEEHYRSEIKDIDQFLQKETDHKNDFEAARQVVDYIYDYHDEFMLVLSRAKGSKYEHYIDQMIQMTEEHYRKVAEQMETKFGTKKIEDGFIHWFSHTQVNAFAYLLEHDLTKEEAVRQLRQMILFMVSGIQGLYK